MKNLSLISFVGIDIHTPYENLFIGFNDPNIKCEFGVLYSESRKNTRYPDYDFCKKYLSWGLDNNVATSLHLCGDDAINKFLNQDNKIMDLCKLAGRTQLNIKIQNFTDYNVLADTILKVGLNNELTLILQKNATKFKFNEILLSKLSPQAANIHLLNDSSGGFGREISVVDKPHSDYFTGYAGGINPDNVLRIVSLIDDVNSDNYQYYIDMESGVRTNNLFSIEKCQDILGKLHD